MKLATFIADQGEELGVVTEGNKIVSLSRAAPGLAANMVDLIAGWDNLAKDVAGIAAAAEHVFDLSDVHLLSPVRRPGKVFAIGLNYADHIKESGMDMPEQQIWFTKAVTSLNGPFDPIEIPKISGFVDYEVELVAIIGKGGKHISQENSADHIFGYCVGNDVTERAWQHRTQQWSLGKSFDTHAPIGPWITTRDEVSDPHDLDLRCFVNDEERQNSNTQHLVFNIWAQVEQLSQAMTLEPGDVIFTGTPGGIGAAMDPMVFLQAGDKVRCEIDELGTIDAVMKPE